MQILLVEDDELGRDVLQLTLMHAGYEVIAASDGEEAWAMYNTKPYPIIFSDWVMPNLDGIELCKRIREADAENDRYTYFLIGTAHDHGLDNYKKAVQAGVDNFLYKPWDPNELLMSLEVAKRTLNYIDQIGKLQQMIAICRYCKKVNTSEQFWERIEKYVRDQTGSDFSHGICPECAKKMCEEYGLSMDFLERYEQRQAEQRNSD